MRRRNEARVLARARAAYLGEDGDGWDGRTRLAHGRSATEPDRIVGGGADQREAREATGLDAARRTAVSLRHRIAPLLLGGRSRRRSITS